MAELVQCISWWLRICRTGDARASPRNDDDRRVATTFIIHDPTRSLMTVIAFEPKIGMETLGLCWSFTLPFTRMPHSDEIKIEANFEHLHSAQRRIKSLKILEILTNTSLILILMNTILH